MAFINGYRLSLTGTPINGKHWYSELGNGGDDQGEGKERRGVSSLASPLFDSTESWPFPLFAFSPFSFLLPFSPFFSSLPDCFSSLSSFLFLLSSFSLNSSQ